MIKDFQIQYSPKLKIILYSDENILIQNTNTATALAPMGVYYGGIIHLLSPREWTSCANYADVADAFLEQGPLVHEIAHYLTDLKTGGSYEVWFAEGVALYYEYKYTAFEWRKDLKEEAERLSYEDLNFHFDRLNYGLAYRKAFDLINGIVESEGETTLQSIIAVGYGMDFYKNSDNYE